MYRWNLHGDEAIHVHVLRDQFIRIVRRSRLQAIIILYRHLITHIYM